MAALPKKKISKVRGKTRRGHYKVTLTAVTIDKATGTPRLSHRMSPDTGMYNGRVALKTKMSKDLERKLARSARAAKSAEKKSAAKKTESAPKPAAKKAAPKKTSEKKSEE